MNKTVAEMNHSEMLDFARNAKMSDDTRAALLFFLDADFRDAVRREVSAASAAGKRK